MMDAVEDDLEKTPHPDEVHDELREVQELLGQQKRAVIGREDAQPHDEALRNRIAELDPSSIARILEALPQDECLLVWAAVAPDRGKDILDELSEAVSETLVGGTTPQRRPVHINAFELHDGRLTQIPVESLTDLAATKPIWVDLIAPSKAERLWVAEIFGLVLPDLDDLTDLEESARFYIRENGEVHLHSDFLLDKEDDSRNVAVAFILHNNILFSMRDEELPVFRLQRLRARIQPGMVSEGKDVLLDLYAADVEYSADALEDVYAELEAVGRTVLSPNVGDEEAAEILSDIAKEEDLNGRIRRNVLDTRRALSFLMRGRLLAPNQYEDARQILRDIESLDGHTSFLFGKINFLMDATVGFININQNKRVSKLTTIGVVFTPINILAGIGGMSEFSMMTRDIPWPVAYGAFTGAMVFFGVTTYYVLRYFDQRRRKQLLAGRPRREG